MIKTRLTSLLAFLAIGGLCLANAQGYDDDDIYYNPSKAKKQTQKVKKTTAPAVVDYPSADSYTPAPGAGTDIDIDTYNRRGVFAADTARTEARPASSFENTRNIERFYNPQVVVESPDQELLTYYYSEPAPEVNIVINTPGYWGWGYTPYYYGSPWYWGTPRSWWYYNSWAYNPWVWGWGPSWSWTWGPSWGWGPSWSWGWGGGYYPGGWNYPHRPGWANRPVGNSRPGYRPGSSVTGNHRPGYNTSGRYPGYRPGSTSTDRNPGYRGGGRGTNRSNGSNYGRPSNNRNTSTPSYRNPSSGSYRGSGGSYGGPRGGSYGGSRSGGGAGRGRH